MITNSEECSTPVLFFMQIDECAICGQTHSEENCTLIEKITEHVKDTPARSYARLTLPDGIEVRDLTGGNKIVVATKPFRKGVRFGPFIAKTSVLMDVRIDFPLKVFLSDEESVYLESNEELFCNWMCLVPPASNQQEQNLLCYQVRTSIYFCTLQEIKQGEELRVWYAPYYAEKMGVESTPKPAGLAHRSDQELCDIFTTLQTEADVQHETCEPKNKKRRKEAPVKQPVFRERSSRVNPLNDLLPGELLGAKERRQEWQCKECGQLETHVAVYARHLMTHCRPPRQSPFTCPYCQKSFKKNGFHRQNHIQSCKPKNDKETTDQSTSDPKTSNEKVMEVNEPTASGSLEDIGSKTLPLQDDDDDDDSMWNSINSCPPLGKENNRNKDNNNSVENSSKMCESGSESLNKIEENQKIEDTEIEGWSSVGEVQAMKPPCPIDGGKSNWGIEDESFEAERNGGLESLENLLSNQPVLGLGDDIDFKISNSLADMISDHCEIEKELPFPNSDRSSDLLKNGAGSNLLPCENLIPESLPVNNASQDPSEKTGFLPFSFTSCDVTDEERDMIVENLLSETDEKLQVSDYDITDVCVSDNIDSDWNGENENENENVQENSKKKESKKGGDFKCDICGKCFERQPYLYRHLRKHTGEFRCNFCFLAFARKESLSNHKCTEAATQRSPRILCPICKQRFSCVKSLDKHVEEAHYCKDPVWKCSCGKSASDASLITNHDCPSSTVFVTCVSCKQRFKSHDKFLNHSKHIISKRSEYRKDSSTVCEFCGLVFKSSTGARMHRLNHGEKRFECSVCEKKFTRKNLLVEHLQRHETPLLKCRLCDRKLVSERLLRKHYKLMHESERFKCEHCDKEFRQKGNLARHMKQIHLPKEHLIKCRFCDKSFTTKESYETHFGKTRCPIFQCFLCKEIFNGSYQLKVHMRGSHSEMYKCKYCNAFIRYQHFLKKHLSCKHAGLVREWDTPGALAAMIYSQSDGPVFVAGEPAAVDNNHQITPEPATSQPPSAQIDLNVDEAVQDGPVLVVGEPEAVDENYQIIPDPATSQPASTQIDLIIDEAVQDDAGFVTTVDNTIINYPLALPKGYQLAVEDQTPQYNTVLLDIDDVQYIGEPSGYILTDPSANETSEPQENYVLLYFKEASDTSTSV